MFSLSVLILLVVIVSSDDYDQNYDNDYNPPPAVTAA